MIVSKVDGRIRICTNFRDVKKAFPKDDFPLPNIDTLVDDMTGHKIFSFMDGLSRYNKILIIEEDRNKMTFTTQLGTYCYRVMPFGLKNARPTYQRDMTYILHEYMHDIVEEYMDEFIVKTKTCNTHLALVCKVLDRLPKYNVRLNPKKYVFGISSGKLLIFIISNRGIEVDPNKVQAINKMPPPKNLKQLQSLQGKIQFIRRFIAQLFDKYRLFNKLLKKNVDFVYNLECQEAFNEIKKYLMHPPIVIPP